MELVINKDGYEQKYVLNKVFVSNEPLEIYIDFNIIQNKFGFSMGYGIRLFDDEAFVFYSGWNTELQLYELLCTKLGVSKSLIKV